MRIDRLDLMAYGPFKGTSLDLAAGVWGLHVIYGDNEAGKSTTLRALIAWLFGIPARTRDSFLHTNPQLRIGGCLRRTDGRQIEFIRRKGNRNTLLAYGAEEPLDDAVLRPFLPAGIDEDLFSRLWGIDHARLTAGGRELLEQSGDLGQALFSAAVGTDRLRSVLNELQAAADAIFKPRASTRMLNQAAAGFREAQKKVREASLSVTEWKRLQQQHADLREQIGQIENQMERNNKDNSRLARLRRVRGALAERRAILVRLQALDQVLLLPEEFEDKCKAAGQSLQSARNARVRAEARLSAIEAEAAGLSVRHELLNNEALILQLYKELGAVEKNIGDRPAQDSKRRQLRNEAHTLLKGVRPDLDLDQAELLRPLLNHKNWISSLAQQHSLLNQKKEKLQEDQRDLHDQMETFRKEYTRQPQTASDLSALKAAVAEARKAGDVEHRLADVEQRISAEDVVQARELRRLGRFTGVTNDLLHLALPVPETLDIFEKQADLLAETIRDGNRRQQELIAEQQQVQQELKTLLLTSDVPVITDLQQSRRIRNTGWRLIKGKYIQNIDVEKELAEYAGGTDLPVRYEQNVAAADQLADHLRRGADQVAKRAELETRRESLTARLAEQAEVVATAVEAQNAQRTQWQDVWAPLAINPASPREMKQWLLRVEKLVARFQTAQSLVADAQKLAEELVRLKNDLCARILEFEPSTDCRSLSLETMICLCEQRVEQEEALCQRRHRLLQSQQETEIQLQRKQKALKSIEAEQAAWLQEWSQAIEGLGVAPQAHPERATGTFEQLVAFFDRFDRSEELRRRIFGMDQVTAQFRQRVLDFAEGIEFSGKDPEATAIAAQLNQELGLARDARTARKALEIRQKEITQEIENGNITIDSAQSQLAALRTLAKVDSDDDLADAGAGSRQKRELHQKLERLDLELNRNGDGLSIAELEQEAAATDIDTIEGELEKIAEALLEQHRLRDALRDQRQTIENAIQAKDGSAAAADASEEAEEHFAAMVSGAEQYLRLQIAAMILEQRIEDYRRANQAPVLARAAKLFSRLTLGSYAGLRDDLDVAGRVVLRGVRPNQEEVDIDGMSDGSRDQLYLALRLATLEQHLRKGEPLPFVVDDILIGFDDKRTNVCLQVFAELAARTQVLLFTHHRRVLELARTIQAPAGIYTHELVRA